MTETELKVLLARATRARALQAPGQDLSQVWRQVGITIADDLLEGITPREACRLVAWAELNHP